MTGPRDAPAALAALDRAPRWAGRLAAAFALYAVVLELSVAPGFVAAVGSTVGVGLLVGAGVLLVAGAAAPLRPGAPGTLAERAARALLLAGGGLLLAAAPLSLSARESRTLDVGEGMDLPRGALPGLPAIRFGEVRLAPSGPHLLSKTVEIAAAPQGGGPSSIGLFPPTAIGRWSLSVFKFGYAPGIVWEGPGGLPVAEGLMMLGTFPKTEEAAALVSWLPEPNVMLGVGTFPPDVEDLLTPPGTDLHLFMRLEAATIAGVRRDLTSGEAWRWAMDGRLEDPLLLVQVFRGSRKLFEGRLRGGEAATFPGGRVEVAPEVLLWVELLASRDPFLAVGIGGAALVLAGGALAAAAWLARRRRGGAAP